MVLEIGEKCQNWKIVDQKRECAQLVLPSLAEDHLSLSPLRTTVTTANYTSPAPWYHTLPEN